ncbi:MAG: GAF domain-containing protein [Leptolyngbyaceae bacterium]|nr:GAF domain-containing protein [Leptolyngbyaceae bacterium]
MNSDILKPSITLAELNRLSAFCQYAILDTGPEKAFDELTQLAATLCQVPIALISLVDHHRQWFKSKVGLDVSETPREVSFCTHVVQSAHMLIVADTSTDPHFSTNPLVLGEPYIRFYAGAPLITPENEVLGTLCVIDVVPRRLTPEQIQSLEVLSHQVMTQLELRRKLREADQLMEAAQQREQVLQQEVQVRQQAEAQKQMLLHQHQRAAAKLAQKTYTLNRFNIHLKQLHCLSTKNYGSFDDLCTDYLRVGCLILGCPTGIISRIVDQCYRIIAIQSPLPGLQGGDIFRLADTYCAKVITQSRTVAYTHVGEIAAMRGHPCYQNLGLETYIGTAIWVNGAIYGTLNFSSTEQRDRNFTAQEQEILELMAASIGKFIAINQAEAQIRQQAETLSTTLQELRAAQAQIVQQAKTSSLGILAGGVAHEINNPINFIGGNLKYLQRAFDDLVEFISLYQTHDSSYRDELQRRFADLDWEFLQQDLPNLFDSIHTGVDRVQGIVSALRTFVRLDETGLKPIALHDSLDNTLLLLQHRLHGAPDYPEIDVIRCYGELPLVEGYPGALNQTFMNLLTNAVDAIAHRVQQQTQQGGLPHPGQIGVRTRQLDSGWVEVAIADNGSGIDPAIRPHIFDPFFTTKPVGAGAGLGLATSYQLIEQHGGMLQCNPREDGTEFVIQIPVKQGEP